MKKTIQEHELHPWAARFILLCLGMILFYLAGIVYSVATAKVGDSTRVLQNAYQGIEYAMASLFLTAAGGLSMDLVLRKPQEK